MGEAAEAVTPNYPEGCAHPYSGSEKLEPQPSVTHWFNKPIWSPSCEREAVLDSIYSSEQGQYNSLPSRSLAFSAQHTVGT